MECFSLEAIFRQAKISGQSRARISQFCEQESYSHIENRSSEIFVLLFIMLANIALTNEPNESASLNTAIEPSNSIEF